MNTPATSNTLGTALSLPMTAVFLVVNHSERTVAHALDFDLVAVAPTEAEAVRKLRTAVKHHVEFGLSKGFDRDILKRSPQELWDCLTLDATLSIGEPIEICNYTLITATKTTTDNEDTRSLAAA